MARKTTAVPSDQLDRLKQVYPDQRDALVTLAAAEESVVAAKTKEPALDELVSAGWSETEARGVNVHQLARGET